MRTWGGRAKAASFKRQIVDCVPERNHLNRVWKGGGGGSLFLPPQPISFPPPFRCHCSGCTVHELRPTFLTAHSVSGTRNVPYPVSSEDVASMISDRLFGEERGGAQEATGTTRQLSTFLLSIFISKVHLTRCRNRSFACKHLPLLHPLQLIYLQFSSFHLRMNAQPTR